MIRLRQSIEAGLRHPVLGPVLVILLALILAFVVVHTVEHGVEGLLFSCAIIAGVALRLAVVVGRRWRAKSDELPVVGRAPPRRAARLARPAGVTPVIVASPLRL